MKAKEIRDLQPDEIRQRIRQEQEQLQEMRFKHAVGTFATPAQLRISRRLIARLQTILSQKEQAV